MICIGLAIFCEDSPSVDLLLTLPMRRAERARLFLDLFESSTQSGAPVEESLISIAHSRDLSMGVRFHLVAAWLEEGLGLGEALAKVPRFLPPQITAMLAGQKFGDIKKVLPGAANVEGRRLADPGCH